MVILPNKNNTLTGAIKKFIQKIKYGSPNGSPFGNPLLNPLQRLLFSSCCDLKFLPEELLHRHAKILPALLKMRQKSYMQSSRTNLSAHHIVAFWQVPQGLHHPFLLMQLSQTQWLQISNHLSALFSRGASDTAAPISPATLGRHCRRLYSAVCLNSYTVDILAVDVYVLSTKTKRTIGPYNHLPLAGLGEMGVG